MTLKDLSVKKLFRLVVAGLLLSMTAITLALFLVTKQPAVLLAGGALFLCALVWFFADAGVWKAPVPVYL